MVWVFVGRQWLQAMPSGRGAVAKGAIKCLRAGRPFHDATYVFNHSKSWYRCITFVLRWLQVFMVENKGKCLPTQSHASVLCVLCILTVLYNSVCRRFIKGIKPALQHLTRVPQAKSVELPRVRNHRISRIYMHFGPFCMCSIRSSSVFFSNADLPTLVVTGATISSHLTKLRDLPHSHHSVHITEATTH